MNIYTCINRYKENWSTTIYTLMCIKTNTMIEVGHDELVAKLKNNEVCITNLKLSKNNHIILRKDDFQNNIDKTNNNKSNINDELEKQADTIIENVLRKLTADNIFKVQLYEPKGTINTFSIRINPEYTKDSNNIDLVFRYRKNIMKRDIVVRLIGIERDDIPFKLRITYDFNINIQSDVVGPKLINEISDQFLEYIAKLLTRHCCGKDKNHLRKLYSIAKSEQFKIRSKKLGATMTIATILVCSSIVTGCGTSNTTVDNKQTSVEETYGIREYKCDYKTGSLKTVIALNIDGQDVIIQGNLFTIIEDPLTMKDSDGNILAYADDSFKLISEDDHAIVVDGEMECLLKGNIDLIGKSYNVYNADGEQIATFKRNTLTTFDARLTDVDDNLIAEYSRGFLRNDFTIKVYDNEKLSDKAIVMIMSSFVSDQKYEE